LSGSLVPCWAVPHHVTAFFTPYYAGEPLLTGSRGAGIILTPLARVCYGAGSRPQEGPVARVLDILSAREPLSIHEPLPARRGYATSAAVTLAAALAVAAFRGGSLLAAAQAAHRAEVECKTGLGDVLALSSPAGGVAVRIEPGAPGVGRVDYIPAPPTLAVVTASRGEEETSSLLGRLSDREASEALNALRRLERDPTFDRFVEEATNYSLRVGWLRGLLGDVAAEILSMEGVLGGYSKKRVAVFIVERDRAADVADLLSRYGYEVRLHEFWRGGLRLEWIYPEQAPPWGE